jgi:hypothetical protein
MLNVMERSEYINSPANEIREGAAEVRKNLRNGPSLARKQAVNNDMRAKGLTNSCGVAVCHTLDKWHAVMRPCNQFFMHQRRVRPLCAWTSRATIRGSKAVWTSLPLLGPSRNAHGVCEMLYRRGWSVTL